MLFLLGGVGGSLRTNGRGPPGEMYRAESEIGTIRGSDTSAFRQVVPKGCEKTELEEASERGESPRRLDLWLEVEAARGEAVRGGVGGGRSSVPSAIVLVLGNDRRVDPVRRLVIPSSSDCGTS